MDYPNFSLPACASSVTTGDDWPAATRIADAISNVTLLYTRAPRSIVGSVPVQRQASLASVAGIVAARGVVSSPEPGSYERRLTPLSIAAAYTASRFANRRNLRWRRWSRNLGTPWRGVNLQAAFSCSPSTHDRVLK